MTWDELREYCLAKPGAWPDEPWGDGVVAKVGPKIFAFLGAGDEPGADRKPAPVRQSVGLKCGATREAADEWLLRFPGDASVMRYIGRSGWNNLVVGGAIPDDEIFEAVDASYATVVSKLPKKDRPGSANRPPGPPYPGPEHDERAQEHHDADDEQVKQSLDDHPDDAEGDRRED